jgi:RimJ/RimL family protein N-acetyltransferase
MRQLVSLPAGDLVLRSYVAADLSDLRAAFADPLVKTWNPGPSDDDESGTMAAAWMSERNDWSNGSHASWAVGAADGRLLGSVSLHKIDHEQNDAEVGYWLAPWARGHGWGALAVAAAARFGFERLHLHRLHLFHAVENEASCRLATTAGFALEGLLRESYRFADGRYHDEHLHGRLADDPEPHLLPGSATFDVS